MSLELVRESTKVNCYAGEDSAQTIIEHDIIVPDINPDVSRILLFDGDVLEKSSETVQDRVLVEGTIRYKILYISDESEQSVKSINVVNDFSQSIDIPNVRGGMKAKVKYDIEHIDYEILNGRKINVKTILKMDAKALEEVEQHIVTDLSSSDDIQVLKDEIEIHRYLGENTVNCSIDEALEIPAGKPSIKEILRSDVKIVGKDFKVSDNKIIAKGDLNILTLYVGDNEERDIQFMEHEVPFTQFIEVADIGENSDCDVDYRISGYSFSPTEDSDGELRVLNGEISLRLCAYATDKTKVSIISDAYSLNSRLNLETEPITVDKQVYHEKSQIILKDIISVDGDSPDISQVFNVLSKPSLFDARVENGMVCLEGAVNNSILYVANNTEQPVFCYYNEMPFKNNVEIKDVKSNMKCDVDLDVEHCNYSMISANEVEIRIVINVMIKVFDKVKMALISKINESGETEPIKVYPSITIYFCQPGDNLWKVAKKYNTVVDDIKKVNGFSEDEIIIPGQQIIIPRKIC